MSDVECAFLRCSLNVSLNNFLNVENGLLRLSDAFNFEMVFFVVDRKVSDLCNGGVLRSNLGSGDVTKLVLTTFVDDGVAFDEDVLFMGSELRYEWFVFVG